MVQKTSIIENANIASEIEKDKKDEFRQGSRNEPLRKVAYGIVYYVLTILIKIACKTYKSRKWMFVYFPIGISFYIPVQMNTTKG